MCLRWRSSTLCLTLSQHDYGDDTWGGDAGILLTHLDATAGCRRTCLSLRAPSPHKLIEAVGVNGTKLHGAHFLVYAQCTYNGCYWGAARVLGQAQRNLKCCQAEKYVKSDLHGEVYHQTAVCGQTG